MPASMSVEKREILYLRKNIVHIKLWYIQFIWRFDIVFKLLKNIS